MTRAFILPITVLAVLGTVFGMYLWQIGSGQKTISQLHSALIDKPAPPTNLPPISGDGPGLSNADFKGKVSLVNVWASWCPPCRVEHPLLMRLSKERVPIFGINYKDKPEEALRFLFDLGDPYNAVGADRTGRTAIDWGVYGYPETFVIDKAGNIRYRHVGPLHPHDLTEKIYPLLKRLRQ